ncbi:MaoC family dehydratase [Streptomyces sp. NPDC002564]|uniref:MaoC family dehydratase n=1 Tax=Streptomyces sp. NPDC002564 TaxID=3364649 RepID=UPI0036C6989E
MRATDVPLPALLLRAAALSPLKHPAPGPATQAPLTATRTPDPRHLAAYQKICGFPTDDDTGTGTRTGGPLPLTYPHVLAFPLAMRLMAAPAFPLPLLGLVHTSIELTRHHPLHHTQELELTVQAERFVPHRRGTEAVLRTEATTKDGTLLWESTSTYLARHTTKTTPPPHTPTPTPAPAPTEPLQQPDAVEEWTLPPDLGRRYATVSGDRNPIHLHPLTARPFGFPRAIAHGMWTAARCLAQITRAGRTDESKQDEGEPTYAHVEFRSPVLLPATVTYTRRGPAFTLHGLHGLHGAQARTHLIGRTEPSAALP